MSKKTWIRIHSCISIFGSFSTVAFGIAYAAAHDMGQPQGVQLCMITVAAVSFLVSVFGILAAYEVQS